MKLDRRRMLQLSAGALAGAIWPGADAAERFRYPRRERTDWAGLVNAADYEELARKRLPRMVYEYIAGGAGDEITMRWNREAFDAMQLLPRVLVDVEKVDTSLELFGQKHSLPVLFAPTAFHRLVHPEGEVETARGADQAGVGFVVSSLSTRRLEDIARATKQPLWFQFFTLQKARRPFVSEVLQEAKAAGCGAIVVTVDAPVTGARNRSERARFKLPDEFETPYYPDRSGRKQSGGLPISGSLTWEDVEWLRSATGLPVLLKGILHPEDARKALQMGVNGLVVSNHGGRELDTVPASISALPRIMEVVGDAVPVLLDSGIRRGTDVVKALAHGAKAVLLGRPYLYGLACDGAAGAARVTSILRREFEMAMQLLGTRRLSEIDRSVFA
jgi:4-hydroxymandelate oxidase